MSNAAPEPADQPQQPFRGAIGELERLQTEIDGAAKDPLA